MTTNMFGRAIEVAVILANQIALAMLSRAADLNPLRLLLFKDAGDIPSDA